MKNQKRIALLSLIVILSSVVLILLMHYGSSKKYANKTPYYRLSQRFDYINSQNLLQPFIDANNKFVKAYKFNDAVFLTFESLNAIDYYIKATMYPRSLKYIYGLAGSDLIASKSQLALILRSTLPDAAVSQILPVSYLTDSAYDMKKLEHEFQGHMYVMKKNIQQQKGFLISDDLNEIMRKKNEYVVVQRILQDPYLVDGYKINMRVYMLVIVNPHNAVNFYYYSNGFMYYTVERFKEYSKKHEEIITTGLAGRDMYKNKPLTHHDLYTHLGNEKSNKLKKSIYGLIKYISQAYTSIFMEENKSVPGTKFLVYGVDVAPNKNLDCMVMEVNKGPDLRYKDERDKHVKLSMIKDMFALVGLTANRSNGFIKVV